jgi:hypothetical protein
MFLYYLQKKGWLKWKGYIPDKRYIKNLWGKYKKYRENKDTFYSLWLSQLFFSAFNKTHEYLKSPIPDEIKESFNLMPFLNGGLFPKNETKNELDKIDFKIPDTVFELLFETDSQDKNKGFFERFNFTIREDTPLDVEVAVDPEMLGKVYESLIAEEERQKAGIFYTPRVEIDLMCRLSLVEYLFEETKIPKDDLITLVFEPQEIENYDNLENLRKIKSSLDNVKIVDPCVGSASFLVGMMNVLVEIHSNLIRKIEKKEENLFALKQKIILENLYGVDVKDWAVMVGELRLWLSLIIETDEKYMDIYTKPLLPNLSFKIRQGDSLLEEIAGQKIMLRKEFAIPSLTLKEKVQILADKKAQFFSGGRSADLKEKEEIEKLENEIFNDLLDVKIRECTEKIEKLNEDINLLRAGEIPKGYDIQLELFRKEEEVKKDRIKELLKSLSAEKEKLEGEKKNYISVLNTVKNKTKKDYFLWEIDFAEVFYDKGGFDIVIGNPPYVQYKEIGTQYILKLNESIKLLWDNIKIDGKSDLYIYFYYQSFSLLRPNGIFCFINSNFWLDVDYGYPLQEFLLKNMKPIYIIDNIVQRTFEADINTVIVLIKRPKDKNQIKDEDVLKFIAFKKPFEEIAKADVFKRIEREDKFVINDIYRLFPKKRLELLEEGVEIPEDEGLILDVKSLPYIGNKWSGKYLRAPEVFFKIINKYQLKRLSEYGKIITGLKESGYHSYIIPYERNNYPILKNPRSHAKIKIDSPDSSISKKEEKLVEKAKVKKALILWLAMRGDRHICYLNYNRYSFTGNFFGINPYNIELFADCLLFYLNSTISMFFAEIYGRKGFGGGANILVKSDLTFFPILKDEDLLLLKSVTAEFENFLTRPIKSIFEELGFQKCKNKKKDHPEHPYEYVKPEEVSFDRIMPDRRELDKIVFEALGLTEEEQLEVYRAVLELVKNRLLKAKSK